MQKGDTALQTVDFQSSYITVKPLSQLQKHRISEAQILNQKFDDPDFPKNSFTIFNKDTFESNIVWKRASQVLKRPEVFKDKIQPNDIIQGHSNCYFMAAIAALAQYPQRIRNLFVTKQINDQYAKTKTQELWPVILQKAWAKYHGGYFRIGNGGIMDQGLRAMTGAPTASHKLQNFKVQQFFKKSSQWHLKKYVAVACSNSKENIQKNFEGQEINIVNVHAYSLLGSFKLDGPEVYLVKLRNPWGNTEIKTSFHDEDPVWDQVSQEDKVRLGFSKCNDGVFFMTIQDFLKSFMIVTVSYIADYYSMTSAVQNYDFKHALYYQIQIPKAQKYNLRVEQSTHRFLGKASQYKFNPMSVVIGKKEIQSFKYVEGFYKNTRYHDNYYQLQQGIYVVYFKLYNTNGCQRPGQYALSVYGPKCSVSAISRDKYPRFLELNFQNAIMTRPFLKPRFSKSATLNYFQYIFCEGFKVCMFKNDQQETHKCKLSVQLQEHHNLKGQFKGETELTLIAEGNGCKVVLCRSKRIGDKNMSVKTINIQ